MKPDKTETAKLQHELEAKLRRLEKSLAQGQNQEKLTELSREYAETKTRLEKFKELALLEKQMLSHWELAESGDDPELASIAREELPQLEKKYRHLKDSLFKEGSNDKHTAEAVILEVRAGTGGEEAALFANNLLRMYTRYAERKGWPVELLNVSKTDLGGIREAELRIKHKEAARRLMYESGVHRVQRIPETEKQGRIHTSTASVAVLPVHHKIQLEINPSDLRVDTFRSSGKGGQHVNVTDSAVRITHIPTGVVVSCQNERSQHKNKEKALSILKSKLHHLMKQKNVGQLRELRREQIGGQERSEKIRTYNFPQDRVTDHRLKKSWRNLENILDGDIEKIIQASMEGLDG